MRVSSRASALGVRRLIAGACIAVSTLAGCSADDVQGPPRLPEEDVGLQALVVPSGGLVGEWKLDGNGNDTKSGNNAIIAGAAQFVSSPLGSALDLNNGSTGTGPKYAQMPGAAVLDTVQRNNYAISAWFKPYNLPPNDNPQNRFWTVVAKPGAHMGLVYNEFGKFVVRHYLTGNVLQLSPSTGVYPVNAWHHVVGTVNKASGTVKIYVNGILDGTATFAPGTAAREYGTAAFRIGKNDVDWAANGQVDQVRIYNRELTSNEVSELFNEAGPSEPMPRFYVGMSKESIGDSAVSSWTPDGKFQQVNTDLGELLRNAHQQGRRVIVKVTKDNGYFDDNPNGKGNFLLARWKTDFDQTRLKTNVDTLRKYVSNGTLLGHYAIDEPFSDFTAFPPKALDDICGYQKQYWDFVPCLVRERNRTLKSKADSAGHQYTKLDAGWAQLANHQLDRAPRILTDSSVQKYFRDELQAGRDEGLALVYGFNLLDGGTDDDPTDPSDCADHPNGTQCAMTPDEVRMVADAIASIGDNQGCGVNGWVVDAAATASRQYFLRSDVQDALHYLWNKTAGAGLQPGPCSLRNLPAP